MNQTFKLFGAAMLIAATSVASAQSTPPPPPPPTPQAMPVPAPPQLGAGSYILVDFNSGRVLVEEDADSRVEPASITKLMTVYAVFNELAHDNIALDDLAPVSEKAWRMEGSRMFIDPSMQVSIEDLLMGVIVSSGNDASVALAEFVGGSEEGFAVMMNHYADYLGLSGTNFVNSSGMPDENHYTTARDIATLSAALIRDFPQYYEWFSVKSFQFNIARPQPNRNNLLWRDPAVDGLKTGHTQNAGYCLAASAQRDGMRLISVVMGAASDASRTSESHTLLNYGFRYFETLKIYDAGQELATAQVWKGEAEDVALGLTDEFLITFPRGRYDDLNATMELQPDLTAPLEEGQAVGKVVISLDDIVVGTRDLVTLSSVPEAGFFGRAWDGTRMWVGDLFSDDADEKTEAE